MKSNTGQVINLGSLYHRLWHCGVGGPSRDLDCTDAGTEAEEYAQPSHLSTNAGGHYRCKGI